MFEIHMFRRREKWKTPNRSALFRAKASEDGFLSGNSDELPPFLIIVKSFGYSAGFGLALLAGWLHGVSSTGEAFFNRQTCFLMLSLWASSLSFFYFYCLLFNAGRERALKSSEMENHLTVSGLFSIFLTAVFSALSGSSISLSALPIACWAIYLPFAFRLAHRSDAGVGKSIRFQLVVPVLAATAMPFCIGTFLAEGGLPSLLGVDALVLYIVAVFILGRDSGKLKFVVVSLFLVALVVCSTLFASRVPSVVGETSTVLFMSVLIAAVSAVFESWRIADREKAKRGDYFLSSSLALVAAILLFPLILLAGGFSNVTYYGVPFFLLVCMFFWCICFERWNGKWKCIKTFAGFGFLAALVSDPLIPGLLLPADVTLFYSPQSLESLAMAMALFGLYGNQVSNSINEAKREEPALVIGAGRLFFQDRANFFRFIGCVSSMLFSVMYVVQNLLGVDAVGAVDVSDLMGSYMYTALLCAAFDFILVFFVSEKTLKGGRLDA